MHPQERLAGFYLRFFVGAAGNSITFFVYSDGIVSHSDIEIGIYNGLYSFNDPKDKITQSVTMSLPIGSASITGAQAESEPINVKISLELKKPLDEDAIVPINTPMGPVNTKFRKLRDLAK